MTQDCAPVRCTCGAVTPPASHEPGAPRLKLQPEGLEGQNLQANERLKCRACFLPRQPVGGSRGADGPGAGGGVGRRIKQAQVSGRSNHRARVRAAGGIPLAGLARAKQRAAVVLALYASPVTPVVWNTSAGQHSW